MTVKARITDTARNLIQAYCQNHGARIDPISQAKVCHSDFNKLRVHYKATLRWKPSKKYKRIDNVIRAGRVVLALGQMGAGLGGIPTGMAPDGAPGVGARGGGAFGMDAGMMATGLDKAHQLVSPSYRRFKRGLRENENYKMVKAGKFVLYCIVVFQFVKGRLPANTWPDGNGGFLRAGQAVGRLFAVKVGLTDGAGQYFPIPATTEDLPGCFVMPGQDAMDGVAWNTKNNINLYVGQDLENGPQLIPLAWQDVV